MIKSEVKPSVNVPIVRSIPLNKDLKRYFVMKYRYLTCHNGIGYACDVFSTLRVTLMQYLADESRRDHLDEYLQMCPVRKNGWLRRLFMEADCNPHSVLDFLKLYIGLNEPVVTTEQSGVAEHSYLRTRTSVKKDVPRFYLSGWMSSKETMSQRVSTVISQCSRNFVEVILSVNFFFTRENGKRSCEVLEYRSKRIGPLLMSWNHAQKCTKDSKKENILMDWRATCLAFA